MEYKTLSKRAKRLLKQEEGYDVDFKASAGGLKSEDIVAFANSSEGGAILIGVKEVKTSTGRQRGEIVGCPIGDKDKLSIVNRAETCIPPVDVEIYIENTSRKPFIRLEIPSGKAKPYSTAGGTYKIRGNARTNPLLPSRLLIIFMENEGREFAERFGKATQALETSLADIKSKTLQEIEELFQGLNRLEQSLDEVLGSASNAEGLADSVGFTTDETLEATHDIQDAVKYMDDIAFPHLEMRVNAILDKLGIEDPVLVQRRTVNKSRIAELYRVGYRGRKLIQHASEKAWNASKKEIATWCDEVVRESRALSKASAKQST